MRELLRSTCCIAALLFLLASLPGCTKGPQTTDGPNEVLPDGDWAVGGVRVGNTTEQIRAQFGEPNSVKEGAEPVWKYDQGSLVIKFNQLGKVSRVSGKNLELNGRILLQAGWFGADVETFLGQGYVIERFSPKGGVIVTGSVSRGKQCYYLSGNVRFVVNVSGSDRISGITAGDFSQVPRPES